MMSKEKIFRKRECDLCGDYAFEKHLCTAKVLDGGFTRIEEWEPSGFGAIVINFWECKNVQNGRVDLRLCPKCAEKLDNAITKAIRELKTEGT